MPRRLTFQGIPFRDPTSISDPPARITIFGAPFDSGGTRGGGSDSAPDRIRAASYMTGKLSHVIFGQTLLDSASVVDAGNASLIAANSDAALEALEVHGREILRLAPTFVALGGNHSISAPLTRAVASAHGPVRMLVFDGHLDTWIEGFDEPPGHGSALYRCLDSGAISGGALFGWRGYGPNPSHREWVEARGMAVWTIEDIDEVGLDNLVTVECERCPGPTYLSVDIDVADPAFAPGTSTPEPGGLTSRELLRAIRSIASSCHLVGVDVVEVYPQLDVADMTSTLANRVVLEVIAGVLLRDVMAQK